MPQTVDRIDFACPDVDPAQWPQLSCGAASQLALQNSSLRLEIDRELLFQDNGQIRSFDNNHRLVFDRAGGLLELHEAGDIRFLTGSPSPSEKVRILANGHVGIGTVTPRSPLHVHGAIRTDGALRVAGPAELNGSLTVGAGASIRFELGVGQRVSVGSGGAFEIDAAGTAGGRLTVTTDGNVGIGTASPGANARLHVVGGALAVGTSPHTADAAVHIQSSFGGFDRLLQMSPIGASKPALNLIASNDASENNQWWVWGVTPENTWRIHTGTVFNDTDGLTITSSGNAGIGTRSPAEALDVNGRIKSGALTIGPWPANPNGYMFFGTNALNQADAGNYALLQGAADSPGVTFLNSPASLQFRIRNADKMVLANNGQLQILADSNPILFTEVWSGFPDWATNRAEISNDTNTFKTLMIVGNQSAGIGRRVSVWDRLEVNGPLVTQQAHTIKIGVPSGPYGNDGIRGEPNLWLDAANVVIIKSGFQTRAMDIAERFKTVEQVHAGQVVIFDEPAEAVKPCDRAYDRRVIGIASADPAFILGLDPEQMPIALCGRVSCHVDADIAPIAVGDLLTTSPTRGHAQKVLHPDKARGAIIGKALGRRDAGQGTIPVLVLLQ